MDETEINDFMSAWGYRPIAIRSVVSPKGDVDNLVGKTVTVADKELDFLRRPNTKLFYCPYTHNIYYLAVVGGEIIITLEVLSY